LKREELSNVVGAKKGRLQKEISIYGPGGVWPKTGVKKIGGRECLMLSFRRKTSSIKTIKVIINPGKVIFFNWGKLKEGGGQKRICSKKNMGRDTNKCGQSAQGKRRRNGEG